MCYKMQLKARRENIKIYYEVYEGRKKTISVDFPISKINEKIEIVRITDNQIIKIEILGLNDWNNGRIANLYNRNGGVIGNMIQTRKKMKMEYYGKKYQISKNPNTIEIKKGFKNVTRMEIDKVGEQSLLYVMESESEKEVMLAVIVGIINDYMEYGRYDIGKYKKELTKIAS